MLRLRVKVSSRLTNPHAENIYRLLENKKGPEGPFLESKATYSEAAFFICIVVNQDRLRLAANNGFINNYFAYVYRRR